MPHRAYTANQPMLFPPIYMMERFSRVSELVLMEEAQFARRVGQANCTVIQGSQLIDVVLPLRGRTKRQLCDIEVHCPEEWVVRLLKTLHYGYARYESYRCLRASLEGLCAELLILSAERDPPVLTASQAGTATVLWCLREGLEAPPTVTGSRSLVPNRPDDASEWLARLGRAIDCTSYVCGASALEQYLDEQVLREHGIVPNPQQYRMDPYRRGRRGELQGDATVSVLDPLLVGGRELVCRVLGVEHG